MRTERKRNVYKALIHQYGKKEAFAMYGEFMDSSKDRCRVCDAEVEIDGEWCDVRYEKAYCPRGCFKKESRYATTELETEGFHFKGEPTERTYQEFANQVEKNRAVFKLETQQYWKKKKSQKKRA